MYTAAFLDPKVNGELAFEQYLSPHLLKQAHNSAVMNRFGLDTWNRMPPPVKVQRYLEYSVYRRVFNQFHPQPVRELHKQFAAFRKINLPVPEAKPGTPPETYDMADYPTLLNDHPHAPKTLLRKIRELRSVAEGGDIEFRELLTMLGRTMHEMQKSPSSPPWHSSRNYRKLFPQIPKSLERRRQIEAFLEDVEIQHRSPARFYEEAIMESTRRQPGETPRITELLDKAEEQFFGNN